MTHESTNMTQKDQSIDPDSYTRAVLNILADFSDEKVRFAEALQANLNILEDYASEKVHFEATQQATLNILEDFVTETQKVERINRELASEIVERKNLEITLIAKKEDLEKSLKDLDSFAYSVSHDLKAPLRGIGQVVDWFYEDFVDKVNDEQKENMNLMRTRVSRMNGLIDGILRYSRLGRSGEAKEKVDLKKVLDDVLDSLQPPKDITLEIEGTFPTLSCVEVQIEQVFQNLIGNAIRYTDKKNRRIRIGCRDNDFEWVFSVKDNGPGIAKEHFEKIFQIFQTLKPRDEVESTGIGLSIVKKLVELHNGHVWLESELGKGSTFFFSLPKKGA